jgi:hypothetical protein
MLRLKHNAKPVARNHFTRTDNYSGVRIVEKENHKLHHLLLRTHPQRKMTKLYDIPRESKIYCEVSDGTGHIIFYKIDGMYSYCETTSGQVVHLGATTELIPYKDGYKLATQEK